MRILNAFRRQSETEHAVTFAVSNHHANDVYKSPEQRAKRVAKQSAKPIALERPAGRLARSSSKMSNSNSNHESKIPEHHYIHNLKECGQEGCYEILQESAWNPDRTLNVNVTNGFVHAVTVAYNDHHNLVIRPDDVWIAIVIQFSAYVNGNSETLRSAFVSHEGKGELEVCQDATMRSGDYGKLARDMVKLMKEHIVDPKLADWILPSFSTTELTDTIVASTVFMATLQKYFDYKFCFLCGIPNVTLLGKVEDWETILGRLSVLRQYGAVCNEWADMLEKVVVQFVRARKGSPDIPFWKKICSYMSEGSGSDYVSGWITVFCVFDNDGKWRGNQLSFHNRARKLSASIPSLTPATSRRVTLRCP